MRSAGRLVTTTFLLLGVMSSSVGVASAAASPVHEVGKALVFSDPYVTPSGTLFQTFVAVELANHSGHAAAVHYRLTVRSGTDFIRVTDGTDTAVLAPHEVRWAVSLLAAGIRSTPTSVVATLSPARTPARTTTLNRWTKPNGVVVCTPGLTGCKITGELTYDGKVVQSLGYVAVVVHAGSAQGPVVGAGIVRATGSRTLRHGRVITLQGVGALLRTYERGTTALAATLYPVVAGRS